MTTGQKILQCRKQKGLTQSQLAGLLGVTRQTVSRWESDSVFPETEKLVEMGRLFNVTVDYLLNYGNDGEIPAGGEAAAGGDRKQLNLSDVFKNGVYFEYKSKRTLFGLPLVHVNIGFGRTAKGIIAVGLAAKGIVSFGLVGVGVISFGLLSLGVLAFGTLSAGLFAAGAVCLGIIIAVGAISLGMFSLGALSVGLYATGAASYGYYVAIGDRAFGFIAIGGHFARGTYSAVADELYGLKDKIYEGFNELPKAFALFNGWSKSIFKGVLSGAVTLGG